MKKTDESEYRLPARLAVLFTIIIFLSGCSKTQDNMYNPGGTGGPGTNEVWIQGMAFTPSTITVSAGTTIKWTNKDAVAHTVTSTTGLFDSGSISSNGTYSHTFSTAGTFPYKCTIHPSMTASVTVM